MMAKWQTFLPPRNGCNFARVLRAAAFVARHSQSRQELDFCCRFDARSGHRKGELHGWMGKQRPSSDICRLKNQGNAAAGSSVLLVETSFAGPATVRR